jgi:hypothetical protein
VIRYHRPVNDVVTHPIAPKNTGFERGLYRLDGCAPDQSSPDCPQRSAKAALLRSLTCSAFVGWRPTVTAW